MNTTDRAVEKVRRAQQILDGTECQCDLSVNYTCASCVLYEALDEAVLFIRSQERAMIEQQREIVLRRLVVESLIQDN